MKLGLHPTHHYRHPTRPKVIGDLVAAVDIGGHGGNADKVGLKVKVDGVDVFVGQHDLITVTRNRGGYCEQTRERRVERPIEVKGPRC